MAVEEKADVEIMKLSQEEVAAMLKCWGYDLRESERLYGGYASSNVRVVGSRPGSPPVTLMLKVAHYNVNKTDVEHQVEVMSHVKSHSWPTNYPHQTVDGSFIVEDNGRCVLLLDFIGNAVPGQKLLAEKEQEHGFIARMMYELGEAVASLHLIAWPSGKRLRDVRTHGYAVCNTGDFLKGKALVEFEQNTLVAGHSFLKVCRDALPLFRKLYKRTLPYGLIHGDVFLDNTLFAKDGKLCAIVDWEDSCKGPYVLDLAVLLSACSFSATNDLSLPKLEALLAGYSAKRSILPLEAESLVDFMAVGALACGFYRFGEFNVRQPDSNEQARDSWRIMEQRYLILTDSQSSVRQTIDAAVSRVMEASAQPRGRSKRARHK